MSEHTNFLLMLHVEAMVPLAIADYQQKGGPSDLDRERARMQYPDLIGSHGDNLLYQGKTTAKVIGALVDGLAILAFCPGGITFAGLHFEVAREQETEESERYWL